MGRPMIPFSKTFFVAVMYGLKRRWWPTKSCFPLDRATLIRSLPSSTVVAIGFSISTWTPEARSSFAIAAWVLFGVQTIAALGLYPSWSILCTETKSGTSKESATLAELEDGSTKQSNSAPLHSVTLFACRGPMSPMPTTAIVTDDCLVILVRVVRFRFQAEDDT